MKKGAAKRKGTTTDADDDIERFMNYATAKQMFVGTVIGMSWRLALTVIIPTVAGVHLDRRFDSAPSLTLAGLFLAIAGACFVVASTVKEVNELQEKQDKEKNKQ